ncbi:MAG: hypothetical protein KDD33_10800 [Bdellovibrionales bacterium]|nr:hypothetical protein [Bdellovibrionales bacterium]
MKASSPKSTAKFLIGQNSGQIIVEYILLITISVAIATLLTTLLVGRGEGRSGIIINKWGQLLQIVAEDIGD